jgi:hypothetical protein
LVLSSDLRQEVGPLTVVGLDGIWDLDSREDLGDSKSKVVIDLVESANSVLVNNVFLTLGKLELSGRDHVLPLGVRHRVVEQSSLVGVFLLVSGVSTIEIESHTLNLGPRIRALIPSTFSGYDSKPPSATGTVGTASNRLG